MAGDPDQPLQQLRDVLVQRLPLGCHGLGLAGRWAPGAVSSGRAVGAAAAPLGSLPLGRGEQEGAPRLWEGRRVWGFEPRQTDSGL